MFVMENLYGDSPFTIQELATKLDVSETHLKMLREQTLILLGHEGPFSSQATRGVERILGEYEERARISYLLNNHSENLCNLEVAVAQAAVDLGMNPRLVDERLNIGYAQTRTILRRLAGRKDGISDVPGPALRKSMLRSLLRSKEKHAKAEVEQACLREYARGHNASRVGAALGLAGNVVTMLLAETVRDILCCPKFSGKVQELQRSSYAETKNTRIQTNLLYGRLLLLYLDFREVHALTCRELKLVRMRIAGKRERSVAEALGVNKQDVSVAERAILGLLIPRSPQEFPDDLPLAPLTVQQKHWLTAARQ